LYHTALQNWNIMATSLCALSHYSCAISIGEPAAISPSYVLAMTGTRGGSFHLVQNLLETHCMAFFPSKTQVHVPRFMYQILFVRSDRYTSCI
jgi:hypothetical protein